MSLKEKAEEEKQWHKETVMGRQEGRLELLPKAKERLKPPEAGRDTERCSSRAFRGSMAL